MVQGQKNRGDGMTRCPDRCHIELPKGITACQRFFREPGPPKQRTYGALQAYFLEGRPSHGVAHAFGYSPGAFRVMCHQFRRDPAPAFFAPARRGPGSQPRKTAARELVVALRKRNYSIYEIREALQERHLALSPTSVREVLLAEGFAPLPRRLDEERPARPRPTIEPVADARAFTLGPRQFVTPCGGLFLFVPELVWLDLDRGTGPGGSPARGYSRRATRCAPPRLSSSGPWNRRATSWRWWPTRASRCSPGSMPPPRRATWPSTPHGSITRVPPSCWSPGRRRSRATPSVRAAPSTAIRSPTMAPILWWSGTTSRRGAGTEWDAVHRELRQNPREFGYAQNLSDGKLLAHHLAQAHRVTLGVRQCQRLFRQLDFRLRKPQPLIAHATWPRRRPLKTPPARPRRRT